MHGRLKVKTTAEQEEAKRKEREKKLKLFKAGTQTTLKKREQKEYDEEALSITAQFLQANPDFYTFWNFRREILVKMKELQSTEEFQTLANEELKLIKNCLAKNPKSYGAWHHRRWIMKMMPKPCWTKELFLCNELLDMDERNFHCWAYRRFVVHNSQVTDLDELNFTLTKIEANFSNYSAWHYRSSLLPLVHSSLGSAEDILLKEYDLVQNAAFTDPNDQSVWFYHRWLLGRGEKPLSITLLYITKFNPTIIVQLSKPVEIDDLNCTLKVKINNIPVLTSWKSPLNALMHASTIWYSTLSEDILHTEQKHLVDVSLQSGEISSSLACNLIGQEAWTWKTLERNGMFRCDLSASASSVLEQQLDSCKQLYELEPENKWTLFNCILLMRALDNQGFEDITLQYIDRMLVADPLRCNYYKDLRSKFVIENAIEKITSNERDFSLIDKCLTVLHHMDHLVLMTNVNFSHNHLSSLQSARLLLCVQNLNVDYNCLVDCKGIGGLRYLKTLSLKYNKIKNIEDLFELATCSMLKHLYLEGNPVTDVASLEEIKNVVPSLKNLDDVTL